MKTFLAASGLLVALACGTHAQTEHDRHAAHKMAAMTETRAFPVERLEITNAQVMDQEARLLRFREDVIGVPP